MQIRLPYSIALGTLLIVLVGLMTRVSFAQTPSASDPQTQSPTAVVFENVRIFDGISDRLTGPSNVLVVGNKIQTISTSPINPTQGTSLTQIKGGGRVLMPGLIDAHIHLFMETTTEEDLVAATAAPERLLLRAQENSTAMLMRGFTSGRDVGGPVFALKRSIDRGEVPGPRLWPSGAIISQTSGHGDFRQLSDLPRTPTSELSLAERLGVGAIADGVPEVLRRTREQLMQGASQIKLAAGGGVSSQFDPIDVAQYTESELRAAVEAAEDWNTYVTVHAYTPRSIQKAIRAGVKCIEHGQLMDEETAQIIAQNDVWLSMQPFLDDEDANPKSDPESRAKQLLVAEGTDRAYNLAKQYSIKTAWGTDTLFNPEGAPRQGAKLAKMVRWYSPAEVLRMATSTNAELLAMSGPRTPYRGKLGVVQEDALADLLLVDGNPLEDIELIAEPQSSFVVIMKDGIIYKNRLG